MSSVSLNVSIRQNFHESSENMLIKFINVMFFGTHTFHSMAYYFDRVDIGLTGFADLYRCCAIDTHNIARKCMDYIVLRGGKMEFDDIKKPEKNEWSSVIESLEDLLKLKMDLNELALKTHNIADENQDPSLTDFLEEEVLEPFAVFIRKCGILISNLRIAGPGLGEYQLNKHLKCYLEEVVNPKLKLTHFKSEF